MDKKLLVGDISSLSVADKARISSIVVNLQIRDSLKTYTALAERCFRGCVKSFYCKSLGKQEENCIRQCTEFILKQLNEGGIEVF